MFLKRILLPLFVVAFLLVSQFSFCAEDEVLMINALRYHKSMKDALRPVEILRVPLGAGLNAVGGSDQDERRFTEGVPFAFRASPQGGIWLLDSANHALKHFAADGKLQDSISISNMGPIVRDFTFAPESGFWLLSPIDGFIYRIDATGKILSKIEGFFDARAIETSAAGELLVDMPMQNSVMRFSADETLKEKVPYDESLSMFEGIGNRLLGIELQERLVKLTMRTLASPSQSIVLHEFPLDISEEKVSYAGAEILGKDKAGNIYANLVACHEEGQIYRDRIYRLSPLGKPLGFTDIITVPYLSPDLPRFRIVDAQGRVIFFYVDGTDYVLAGYNIPQL